jgi:hypothetical protein
LTGACIDIFGFRSIFVFGSAAMGIAFFIMRNVQGGEPEDRKSEEMSK